MASTDDLVTTAEAAEIVGRSVPTINRWVAENKLDVAWQAPGEKGARFYHRADVEALATAERRVASA